MSNRYFNEVIAGKYIVRPDGNNFGHFLAKINEIKRETTLLAKTIRKAKGLYAKVVGNQKLASEVEQARQQFDDNLKVLKLIEYATLFYKLYLLDSMRFSGEKLIDGHLRMNQIEKECGILFVQNYMPAVDNYKGISHSKSRNISRDSFWDELVTRGLDSNDPSIKNGSFTKASVVKNELEKLQFQSTSTINVHYNDGPRQSSAEQFKHTPFEINCAFGNIPFNSFFVNLMLGEKFRHCYISIFDTPTTQEYDSERINNMVRK